MILSQEKKFFMKKNDTLSSSFEKCCELFKYNFSRSWPKMSLSYKIKFKIEDGKLYNEVKKDFLNYLDKGYDTKVSEIKKYWNKYNST